MRLAIFQLLFFSLGTPGLFSGAQDPVSLDEVLRACVQRQVQLRENLKYYTCRERVRIQRWQVQEQIRSSQRGKFEFQVLDGIERRTPLTERSRQLAPVVQALGSYSEALSELFGPGKSERRNFQLENEGGVVRIQTRVPESESQTILHLLGGEQVVIGFDAAIELNAEACQLKSFLRTSEQPTREISDFRHQVEYALFDFGDGQFLLPSRQLLHFQWREMRINAIWEYSDCQRFGSDVQIRFGVPERSDP